MNNKLQVLQNKSLRLIYNTHIDYSNLNNRVTTEELHDRAALITLQNRRDAHALFYAYDLAQLYRMAGPKTDKYAETPRDSVESHTSKITHILPEH